ncbi:hypothetical protein RI844_02530 [Thalassotalea fonticola]|uniref:Uncharacterized protein n=1 Tax=Thalassotalea fonticola TaxID=3065649 RepID=A0ABZ0GQQ9_9GAMM|nr:hypothetical protein RI844_02530 [Colwelliaceae bacterium S1-1]
MNKISTLSLGLILTVSTSALANTGLEKAINLQVERANEEIQVLNDFKACIKKSNNGEEIKVCHQTKKVTMKSLWSSRSKK